MKENISHYPIPVIVISIFFFLFPLPSLAKTVIDEARRTVEVPDRPQRVVTLAPSITEIVFELGQQHRLKGVTQFSNFPPEATLLPKVGSYIHLDLEKIVALNPDICIATKDGNPLAVVQRLESLNIPVYVVNPHNFETVIKTIRNVGDLLNSTEQAKKLENNVTQRLHRIKEKVAQIKHRPAVFFQIGISPIVSVGTDTFIHELITLAGAENLAAGPRTYPRFSKEQVLALMPEVIIITTMARGDIYKKAQAEWNSWKQLPAAKNNRVLMINSDLVDRPSPRLVTGLEKLTELIHPDLFKKDKNRK
ncbi:MAG: cobalamin-binding protein [SAR324 cluster bacterium]|nr:cobalamin-binding protein [SAR324 cluster bacterium]